MAPTAPTRPNPHRVLPSVLARRPGAHLALSLLVVGVAFLMIPAPGVGALSSPSGGGSPSTPASIPVAPAAPVAPLHASALAGSSGSGTPAQTDPAVIDRFANYSLSLGAPASAAPAASSPSSPIAATPAATSSEGARAGPPPPP